MIESFLNSVAVIDTEATTNNPELAEILELGVTKMIENTWESTSKLFNSVDPIPPSCSAICNITDEMVQNKPRFNEAISEVFDMINILDTKFYVAHNAVYDIAVLNTSFKRAAIDFNIERDLGKENWICTYRLAKRILGNDDKSMQFGQNFLRYYFKLGLDPYLQIHRAGDDSYVCAHLLVKLLETAISKGLVDPNVEIGPQLSSLSWAKIPVTKWPYGKNSGKLLSELDDGFLRWAILNVNDLNEQSYSYDPDLATSVENEIANRPNFKF